MDRRRRRSPSVRRKHRSRSSSRSKRRKRSVSVEPKFEFIDSNDSLHGNCHWIQLSDSFNSKKSIESVFSRASDIFADNQPQFKEILVGPDLRYYLFLGFRQIETAKRFASIIVARDGTQIAFQMALSPFHWLKGFQVHVSGLPDQVDSSLLGLEIQEIITEPNVIVEQKTSTRRIALTSHNNAWALIDAGLFRYQNSLCSVFQSLETSDVLNKPDYCMVAVNVPVKTPQRHIDSVLRHLRIGVVAWKWINLKNDVGDLLVVFKFMAIHIRPTVICLDNQKYEFSESSLCCSCSKPLFYLHVCIEKSLVNLKRSLFEAKEQLAAEKKLVVELTEQISKLSEFQASMANRLAKQTLDSMQ